MTFCRSRRRVSFLALASSILAALAGAGTASAAPVGEAAAAGDPNLNRDLTLLLRSSGFTGRTESTLRGRLGRRVDWRLARLGRDLFFDSLLGLHADNSCAGCHSPANGFGDTQSIAIGVDNNGVVGPNRQGARNQRRTPMILNTAFFPKLMWNGRFSAASGDPFDNSQGFTFPAPEGTVEFPAHDPRFPHLLAAQGHIPPTEINEMAGFTGTAGTISPRFDPFDNGVGSPVPAPDAGGFRNGPIRDAVLALLEATPAYRARFAARFPEVAGGGPITFAQVGLAFAEFQISMTFADAPLDRFARGQHGALNRQQKRGAVLFFGRAGCVSCHAVAGPANEMFSDFENHVVGVPQIAPAFGVGTGNTIFDGPGEDEDFGAQQISGDPADRYKFRTSPLRNLALQPAFFHNGAFTRLEDAVAFHLDALAAAPPYDAVAAGVDADLTHRLGPIQPVLDRLDPRLAQPVRLSPREVQDLVAFLRGGLLDPRARPERLCAQVPRNLPSGRPVAVFEGCP